MRLAGIMYLLTIASANLGDFYVRRRLFVLGDPAQTFRKLAASSTLVRAGIAADLVTIAGSVILSVALYAILKSVKKNAGPGCALLVAVGMLHCGSRNSEQ